MAGSSNDETNFPHQLLLTNTQVSKICKNFTNGLSANIKVLKHHFPRRYNLEGVPGFSG